MKKRAFTLAEVLITLGIIGVVAAMSIPTLLNFYNRKMLEVRFKKTDAVLIQAMKMASEELGVDSFEVYSNVPQDEREATMDLFNSIWEKQFKGATKYYIKDIGKMQQKFCDQSVTFYEGWFAVSVRTAPPAGTY